MIDTIQQLLLATSSSLPRGSSVPTCSAAWRARRRNCRASTSTTRSARRCSSEITELEEYYPTRTELGIMERHAAEMAGLLGPRCLLIEYGSGSSVKTRLPARPAARPGRLRADRRLGRAPAPLGPGAGRGIPGPRGAAAVR